MLQDRICVAAKGKRQLRALFSATAFHRPFSGIAHRAITPREGRRDPWSPSMGPKIPHIQVPKFRKSEHLPFQGDFPTFFRHFPSGNGETSDFFEANIRGFASKVRRFGYKKSDVFGTFPRFLPSFFHAPAGCCAAKTVQKSGGTAVPYPQICHTRLAEHTNPPRFPRWKGHCTLSGFLKVFTPFPPRFPARVSGPGMPECASQYRQAAQHPLCPPACVHGVAWAQKHTFRTLSTRALHTVRTYYAPKNAMPPAHSTTKTAALPYFFTNFAWQCSVQDAILYTPIRTSCTGNASKNS